VKKPNATADPSHRPKCGRVRDDNERQKRPGICRNSHWEIEERFLGCVPPAHKPREEKGRDFARNDGESKSGDLEIKVAATNALSMFQRNLASASCVEHRMKRGSH
jgi:hypothetical protein